MADSPLVDGERFGNLLDSHSVGLFHVYFIYDALATNMYVQDIHIYFWLFSIRWKYFLSHKNAIKALILKRIHDGFFLPVYQVRILNFVNGTLRV